MIHLMISSDETVRRPEEDVPRAGSARHAHARRPEGRGILHRQALHWLQGDVLLQRLQVSSELNWKITLILILINVILNKKNQDHLNWSYKPFCNLILILIYVIWNHHNLSYQPYGKRIKIQKAPIMPLSHFPPLSLAIVEISEKNIFSAQLLVYLNIILRKMISTSELTNHPVPFAGSGSTASSRPSPACSTWPKWSPSRRYSSSTTRRRRSRTSDLTTERIFIGSLDQFFDPWIFFGSFYNQPPTRRWRRRFESGQRCAG